MNNYTDDQNFIKRCFELASKGIGHVSPNPLVGAVIVKENRVIAEGYHELYGGPHAELYAFLNAEQSVEGATLYTNLEPCSHTEKQTPPCVPLIIKKKIKRVVISNIDPNSEVNGKGIERLKHAGIEVETGILEEEGKHLNRFYFKYVRTKLPYVTLKIAQSLDAKISLDSTKQTYVTGEESNKFVHSQRAVYDAVLVGANTIVIDNPKLSVRQVKGRDPLRVVLDGNFSCPVDLNVFADKKPERTWLITREKSNPKKIAVLEERGIRVFQLKVPKKSFIDPLDILNLLGEAKITSLFVEGGKDLFSQFIERALFDEIILLQSSTFFGKGLPAVELKNSLELEMQSAERLGSDIKLQFYKKIKDFTVSK